MSGRVENDMKIKELLKYMLEDEPYILTQYVDSLADYSWTTKKNYVANIKLFFKWVKEKRGLSELTLDNIKTLLPMDLSGYFGEIKYKKDSNGNIVESSSSKQTCAWTALNSFFEFMTVNEFMNTNICSKTKRPKNRDNPSSKYLDQKQMKQLINKVERTRYVSTERKGLKDRDIVIIKMFLTTGMRAESLREIDIEDIDFENQTVTTINKGHKTKTFILMDTVIEDIKKWLIKRAAIMNVSDVHNQTGPLFVSLKRNRMSYDALNKTVKLYTKLIGIDDGYSCHTLRHSYGTAVYMITKDINYTKDALGHSDVSVTQRYINENDKSMDGLVAGRMSSIVG